ncbi:DUF4199 domain-containing protein [Hymenobacter radiodurans]|uniref:DUF4199 domain-containing protein n=1 Tax=Hymenobacter radiodurans TaxID=2496028 RepID=UPI001058DC33|nr:DUF4199 domain-containing protein [Hymenobacter radiodurans]
MGAFRLTAENNGVRVGLFTGVAMMAYFLIANLLGFVRIEYSFLNAAILAVGACVAIARLKREKGDKLPYLQGFGTGIVTALVASVAFGLFFIIYSSINRDFMEQTQAQDLFGFDLSVTIAFLAIVLQGVMGGMIVSLIAMQYFKSPDHKPMKGIE